MKHGRAIFLTAFALWLVVTTSAVTVVTWPNPKMRAVLGMGWGLILLWIFVYGLMVYLPAYCVPPERTTRPLRWWHYPLAVFVPFLFIPVVPLPLLAGLLCPHHPKLHFPPIGH
jgi:hypothetical protein